MSSSPHLLENQRKDSVNTSMSMDIKSNPPSPHELATMTNVNVLDLHKNYETSAKILDKDTNTLYIYSNHKSIAASEGVETIVETSSSLGQQLSLGHVMQRQNNSIDLREIHRPTVTPTSEEITRIVDNNFIQRLVDNQEVISREYINGEHRIITRNENGEHILTRIVSPDQKSINFGNNFMNHNGEPSVHYDKNESKHHMGFTTDSNKNEPVKQVVYAHGNKEIVFTAEGKAEVYSAINVDDKQHVDLIYEDGNKTVIYTSAEQKGLEVYQSNEISGIGENPVIIQGGLQYTPQPGPNGTTVYVLADMSDDGINDIPNMQATKINGQATPLDVTGLSQSEMQGLLLGSQGTSQNIHVKREPEDLRKESKSGRSQKVIRVATSSSSLQIKEAPSSPSSPSIETMYVTNGSTQIYLEGPSHHTSSNSTSSNANANTPSPGPYVSTDQYGMYATPRLTTSSSQFVSEPTYYREYFDATQNYAPVRTIYGDTDSSDPQTSSPYEGRFTTHKNGAIYSKTIAQAGLTVDLPSPDSGIGADAITPRDQANLQQPTGILDASNGTIPASVAGIVRNAVVNQSQNSPTTSIGSNSQVTRSRPWHDFGRQNDADKIQIPKVFANTGFKYHLESPISSSQRREDDRITYINKGQFYGITLEYLPDPEKSLKNQTVKSIIMLMFREEKSPEDEIKAWQFWHSRQHSVKQRILDADTKNSIGLVNCIEEISHNAIAVYWNPLEGVAKINIAVQCLSTDFSSQKGVKGLPLHVQIDTFEDPRDTQVYHRGYCQIKVFCDKGAERKTRDEERRASKRKMTATGRKKLDELYHPVVDRSEFYAMSDLAKPPVLFSPAEDLDKQNVVGAKITTMDLQNFYGQDPDSLSVDVKSPYLLHAGAKVVTPTLKFHNHFPPDVPIDKKDQVMNDVEFGAVAMKRARISPPLSERVMLYVRQENENVYTPIHLVPPTTMGLLNAIENKFKISTSSINNIYRKNKKGITAKIDDEMIVYYCNEDLFLLEVRPVEEDLYDITLTELPN